MNLLICEGLPDRLHPGVGSTNSLALMTFDSLSKTLSDSRCPRSVVPGLCGSRDTVLSWPVRSRTPLLGLSNIRPSIGIRIMRPLPA
jgi:hypothetical protein